MSIRKEEFYEGAALLHLICGARRLQIEFTRPFYLIDSRIRLYLKYSTRVRSPWGFTFMEREQRLLEKASQAQHLVLGLVCGHDGIVSLPYDDYLAIAPIEGTAFRIACDRRHRERYEVRGPNAVLERKISPSEWPRLFSPDD